MDPTMVRYRSIIHDNERWAGFSFRDDDIIISTPPKCGTTWTQKICSLLIFQTTDLPKPLDLISPWFEQSLRSRDEVAADLEAQEHRRFIKSHTPYDGLPHDDRVTYIAVGRDPRDVACSWDNHMDNIDLVALLTLREKAVGNEDLAELMPDGPPVPAESAVDRFWEWVDNDAPVQEGVSGLNGTLHHLESFWKVRHQPNVILLHYGELKADLEGEMRKLAGRLGIDVPEERWPELVDAATFDRMKKEATKTGPNTSEMLWKSADRFFNKGTSGQWRNVVDDEGLKRYEARATELTDDAEFLAWAHHGPITS